MYQLTPVTNDPYLIYAHHLTHHKKAQINPSTANISFRDYTHPQQHTPTFQY